MQDPINTTVFIMLFSCWYMYHVVKKTARQVLDLYDLLLLSSVVVIPLIFSIFRKQVEIFSSFLGVTFPFVVMFGILFAVVFLAIHRLVLVVNKLEKQNRLLIQELSLALSANKHREQ